MPLAEGEKLIFAISKYAGGDPENALPPLLKGSWLLTGQRWLFYQDIRIRLIVFKPPVKA